MSSGSGRMFVCTIGSVSSKMHCLPNCDLGLIYAYWISIIGKPFLEAGGRMRNDDGGELARGGAPPPSSYFREDGQKKSAHVRASRVYLTVGTFHARARPMSIEIRDTLDIAWRAIKAMFSLWNMTRERSITRYKNTGCNSLIVALSDRDCVHCTMAW